jgi:hypothetical protein
MKNRFIGFVVVLALLFVSCDKENELENKKSSGKEVSVRIRSLSVAPSGSESLTRSALQKEPKMEVTSIGDGMLLEMSIKEDESPLRAVLMSTGKLFRVIAVNHGTDDYYSHGDFTVGISTASTDFHVKIGEKYDYICISYNSDTDLPPSTDYVVGSALPTSFSVDNSNDLLWCRIERNEDVPETGVELEILLEQKLAEVKVTVKCDYNQWKITAVTTDKITLGEVSPSYTIDWSNGAITGTGTEEYQGFTYSTIISNSTSQTSDGLRVFPKGSGTVTVKFLPGAIWRNGFSSAVPAGETSVPFTTELSAGVRYTITVRLWALIWARSNIYWDDVTDPSNPKLTFIPADGTTDYQGYQGVFFKWGSLVGVSPALTPGAKVGGKAFSGTTPIYVPIVNATDLALSTWKATTGDAMANDPDFPDVTSNWTSWDTNSYGAAHIPYLDPRHNTSGTVAFGRANRYAIDDDRNVYDVYKGFCGDICQYLSTKTHAVPGDYRLPTSYEFGTSSETSWNASTPNANGWQKGTGSFSIAGTASGYSNGRADLLSDVQSASFDASENTHAGSAVALGSAINKTMDDIIFPLSGTRSSIGGLNDGTSGNAGFASSGSAYSTTYGYFFGFNSSNVNYGSYGGANPRSCAFPVRCVLND